jgi:hypothetical protein
MFCIPHELEGLVRRAFNSASLLFFIWSGLSADPAFHKFELWGKLPTKPEKLLLFSGWTNGFWTGHGMRATKFSTCIEGMTTDQAIAMIDKYYNNHPEEWSYPLGVGIIDALTVTNSPCEHVDPSQ